MMSSGIHGGQSPPDNNHYERLPLSSAPSFPHYVLLLMVLLVLLLLLLLLLCGCRYREILVSMMDSVLKKIQLRHNINELREIDDDTVDDDVSTIFIEIS